MAKEITYRVGMLDVEGHQSHVDAVPEARREITIQVHEGDAPPWGLDAKLDVVGTPVPRLDGPAKVTGAAHYTYDIQPDRLAYLALVTSPHANARVTGIDTKAAEALPGVLQVRPTRGRRVSYAGAIVAAVCAERPDQARAAAQAVRVNYEVQQPAATLDDARLLTAPQVDARVPNVTDGRPRQRGDFEKAWSDAALRVGATYRTAVQTHSCLEPHGSLVAPQADGTVVLYASTQATARFANGRIASALEVPANKIRVITEHMGGGFGSKFGAGSWDVLAATCARELKRPVLVMLTRRQEHALGGNRPNSIQAMALAGTKAGRIQAIRAHSQGTSGNGPGGSGANNVMVYDIPNVEQRHQPVRTHAGGAKAFRAPRHPQGAFALEGIIDRYARSAGLDPLQVRLLNDPHPIRRIQWRIAAERMDWPAKAGVKRREGSVHFGVGCAAARWGQAGRGRYQVDLRVHADGRVTVMNCTQDIGTGTRTVMAMLAAEELGLPVDHVQVELGDTRYPAGPASGGSTTTPSIGPVIRRAARKALDALSERIAKMWELPAAELTWKDRAFVAGDRRLTFKDAARSLGPDGLVVSAKRQRNWQGPFGETAGCQMAEVAVDVDTGIVRVLRVVAVHDAGRIINPLTSRSQVNGGVIQGVSYALYEERRLDRATGDMVNPTLDTYRIMGMADCPEIDVVLTSVAAGYNNAGLMGLGEPGDGAYGSGRSQRGV